MARFAAIATATPSAISLLDPTSSQAATPSAAGVESVIDHGAVGDAKTDASEAIEQAIAALVARRPKSTAGGAVLFPAGEYAFSRPISVPAGIYLVGIAPSSSRLTYTGSSATSAITFGEPEKIATFCGTKGLAIDASARCDATLTYYGAQEGSGCFETVAIGARIAALDIYSRDITGGTNKFVVDRCWCWTEGDAGLAGIRIRHGGGPLTIRDTTFVGVNRRGAAPEGSAGIVAENSIITVDNVNVESFESHTNLTRSSADIRTPTGFNNSYGVRTSADSTDATLLVSNASFDQVKACITDEGCGVTIRFCRSYSNESYRYDQRHFRRNFWELGSANVYQSDQAKATMGFTSAANADTGRFKFSRSVPGGWREAAAIDEDGVFGTADSTWNGAHLRLGSVHLWVDSTGALRVKSGAPNGDTDGTVLGLV